MERFTAVWAFRTTLKSRALAPYINWSQVLGMVKRSFSYLSNDMTLHLYGTLS
jgi:hypothetical protein